jgi:hypothetical protein
MGSGVASAIQGEPLGARCQHRIALCPLFDKCGPRFRRCPKADVLWSRVGYQKIVASLESEQRRSLVRAGVPSVAEDADILRIVDVKGDARALSTRADGFGLHPVNVDILDVVELALVVTDGMLGVIHVEGERFSCTLYEKVSVSGRLVERRTGVDGIPSPAAAASDGNVRMIGETSLDRRPSLELDVANDRVSAEAPVEGTRSRHIAVELEKAQAGGRGRVVYGFDQGAGTSGVAEGGNCGDREDNGIGVADTEEVNVRSQYQRS